MLKSFINNRSYWILTLPFLYAFFSRMRGARGFFFNAATLWIPGVMLVLSHAGEVSALAIVAYFIGYLIFISLYEIGYLANDTYGLRGDPTPRRRIVVDYSTSFFFVFCIVRLLTVATCVMFLDVVIGSWFIVLILSLGASIAIHNLIRLQHFKFASFLQMSALRFSVPVLLAQKGDNAALTILIGILMFAFPRLLTYQDSKGRLSLPERKNPRFAFVNVLVFSPLVVVVSVLTLEPIIIGIFVYLLVLHAGSWLIRDYLIRGSIKGERSFTRG